MPPIILILFSATLGFGLGYKLKDCLCKKDNPSILPNDPSQNHSDETQNVVATPIVNPGFSLCSIEKLFGQFNIPLTSDYSFSRLLGAIEKDTYVSLLKHIDKEISSPGELYRFLEEESLNVTDFEFSNSTGEPYISEDGVNTILESKEVNHSNLKSIDEKIKFLLILAQGKGVKRFQESFGNDLATFLNKYKDGENTEIIFEEIKSTVHNRVEFLS